MKENIRKVFRDSWWLLGIFCYIILDALIKHFDISIDRKTLEYSSSQISFLFMAIFIFLGYKLTLNEVFFPEHTHIKWSLIFKFLSALFVLQFLRIVSPHVMHIHSLINGVRGYFRNNGFVLDASIFVDPPTLFYVFLSVCVAPVLEEFIFRYCFYGFMKARYESKVLAMILSSIFFTFMHIGQTGYTLTAIILLFIFSLFLSYTYEKSGSILSSIILHALNNGYGEFTNSLHFSYAMLFNTILATIGLAVVLVSLIFFLMRCMCKSAQEEHLHTNIEDESSSESKIEY